MSAYGPKRTSLAAPHMSAFGGKADMDCCGNPLSRSLLEVKRTWAVALQMSAFDAKRTSFGVASAFGTIFAVFPSCNTSATLDAIRRDVALTRPANACFCASQICTIASIQGVAASDDPFGFHCWPRAFELAQLLLGLLLELLLGLLLGRCD
jgi:hypothetical protein